MSEALTRLTLLPACEVMAEVRPLISAAYSGVVLVRVAREPS